MQKLIALVILSVCIFSCETTDRKVIFSNRLTESSYPCWSDTEPIAVVKDTCGGSDNEMTVKSLWSEDSLYFFFEVKDKNLQCHQVANDHKKLFLDDMVEFLLDPRNDRGEMWIEDDIIYHINILGYKKDDRGTSEGISDPSWNGKERYTVFIYGTINDSSDSDDGYSVEVALPWTDLGVVPHAGLVMGVDFVCGDNDLKGRQLFDIAGASPFRHPIQFRDFTLIF